MSAPLPFTNTVYLDPLAGSDIAAGTSYLTRRKSLSVLSSITTTTSGFTVPAVSSTVIVPVASASYLALTQVIYLNSATASLGYYQVTNLSGLNATLQNLGGNYNAAPGTVLPSSLTVMGFGPSTQVLIAANAEPSSMGTATWTNGSGLVTVPSLVNNIDDVEAGWVPSSNVTATYALGKNNNAGTFILGSGFTTGKVAYKALGSTLNLSSFTRLSLYVKPQNNLAANNYYIALCSDSAGATPLTTFNIAALPGGHWSGESMTGTLTSGVNSVALYRTINSGAESITLDHILASTILDLQTVISSDSGAIVSEEFYYPTGNLAGNAGGSGFNGSSWSTLTGSPQVQSPNDTYVASGYPSYQQAFNKGRKGYFYGTTQATRAVPSVSTSGLTTLWVGMLVRMNRTSNTSQFYLSLQNSGTDVLRVGSTQNQPYWSLESSATAAYSAVPTVNTPTLLMARVDFSGSTARYRLWVNPASSCVEYDSSSVADVDFTDVTFSSFNGISVKSIGSGYTDGDLGFIRISDYWRDVWMNREPVGYPVRAITGTTLTIEDNRDNVGSSTAVFAGKTRTDSAYVRRPVPGTYLSTGSLAVGTSEFVFPSSYVPSTYTSNVSLSGGWDASTMTYQIDKSIFTNDSNVGAVLNVNNYTSIFNLVGVNIGSLVYPNLPAENGIFVVNSEAISSVANFGSGYSSVGNIIQANPASTLTNSTYIASTSVIGNKSVNIPITGESHGYYASNIGTTLVSGLHTSSFTQGNAVSFTPTADARFVKLKSTDLTVFNVPTGILASVSDYLVEGLVYSQASVGVIQTDTVNRHTNSGYSWKLSPTAIQCALDNPLKIKLADITVIPGRALFLKGWVYLNSTMNFDIYIPVQPDCGIYREISFSANSSLLGGWQEITTNWTPAIYSTVSVWARAYNTTTGTAWVDDLSIYQV